MNSRSSFKLFPLLFLLLVPSFVTCVYVEWSHTLPEETERVTKFGPLTIGNYLPLNFQSVSKNTTDGIYGCVYAAGNSGTPPFYEIALFQPATLFSKTAWAHTSDYEYSTNYIGGTVMQLEEWTSDGTKVQTIPLNILPWSYSTYHLTDLTYSVYKSGWTNPNYAKNNNNDEKIDFNEQQANYAKSNIDDEGMFYANANNNNNNNNNNQQQAGGERPSGQNDGFKTFGTLNVTFAIAASNKTGYLKTGRWVSPKAMNLWIEIIAFPYKSTANHVHLTFGVMSASHQVHTVTVEDSDSQHLELMGTGADSVFINFPKHAAVDHTVQPVSTTANFNVGDNDLGNWKLTQVIKPYLTSKNMYTVDRVFTAVFPAGAQNITYEPTFGIWEEPIPLPGDENLDDAAGGVVTKKEAKTMTFVWAIFGGLFAMIALIYLRVIWAGIRLGRGVNLSHSGTKQSIFASWMKRGGEGAGYQSLTTTDPSATTINPTETVGCPQPSPIKFSDHPSHTFNMLVNSGEEAGVGIDIDRIASNSSRLLQSPSSSSSTTTSSTPSTPLMGDSSAQSSPSKKYSDEELALVGVCTPPRRTPTTTEMTTPTDIMTMPALIAEPPPSTTTTTSSMIAPTNPTMADPTTHPTVATVIVQKKEVSWWPFGEGK